MSTIKQYLSSIANYSHKSNIDIISAIYNSWDISDLKQAGVIRAYLLNWKPVYFLNEIFIDSDGSEIITRNDIHYEIKYPCNNKEDILRSSKICLSFRECEELKIAVVLVKFIY